MVKSGERLTPRCYTRYEHVWRGAERDTETLIARNVTRRRVGDERAVGQEQGADRCGKEDRRMHIKGTKEELVFNEMARVEVEIYRSTLRHQWRLDTEERRHGKIGFSAQLKWIHHAESARRSA